jgi:hypothetical protein
MKSIGLINIAAYAYAYAMRIFMLRQVCRYLHLCFDRPVINCCKCKCVYLMLRHYLSITDNACQSDMGVVSELPVSDKDKSVNYRCLTLHVSV